ncbi:hypothetical protein ES332_D11G005100v1 [Gossypium tomentosum]|uniref:Uncharacterized protein n=1 Tax=Gossypium tomentosum TaxID=34277 RepID=A0A5D2II61_GOSTO|nr:hypothetical protein ES332_D11G005100v1 [Gossypium tomentosum]
MQNAVAFPSFLFISSAIESLQAYNCWLVMPWSWLIDAFVGHVLVLILSRVEVMLRGSHSLGRSWTLNRSIVLRMSMLGFSPRFLSPDLRRALEEFTEFSGGSNPCP